MPRPLSHPYRLNRSRLTKFAATGLVATGLLLAGCSQQPHSGKASQANTRSDGFAVNLEKALQLKALGERERLEALANEDPDNPEPRYNLAHYYLSQAEENDDPASRELALQHFTRVLELAPGNMSTLAAIYRVHYQHTLDVGKPAFAKATSHYAQLDSQTRLGLHPPSLALFMHSYIAQSEQQKFDYPQLQNLLYQALAEQPQSTTAHIQLARLYRNQGYYPMAIASLKLASEQLPPSARVQGVISAYYGEYAEDQGCAYEQGDYLQRAIHHTQEAIRLEPDNGEWHFRLFNLYLDKNRPQLALNQAQILYEISPKAENLALQAQLYAVVNQSPKALQLLGEAKAKGLDNSDANEHEIYMYAGAWEQAAQAFSAYVQRQKNLSAYDAIKADILGHQTGKAPASLLGNKQPKFSSLWEKNVYQFWTDQLSRQQLAQKASNRCERTELYFYAGYRQLMQGNNQQARQDFAAVLQQDTYRFIERPLARRLLGQMP